MKNPYLLAVTVAAVCSPLISFAQPAIEQVERTQREMQLQNPTMQGFSTNLDAAPSLYAGENEDVGPQHILKTAPARRKWFEVVADSQLFYSDNVFLSDENKKDAPIWVNTVQATFAPDSFNLGPGRLAPAVGYRSQWFNYDIFNCGSELGNLDFNAQTAFASGRYQIGLWQIFGGFDFTRLMDQDKYDEVYREYVPSLGLQRLFPVNDRLVFSVGGQVGYHWTETPDNSNVSRTDANDRFDASLLLAASWQVAPKLVLQPFYRFQYTTYDHFTDTSAGGRGRADIINSMGATLTYYFTRNFSMRIFANYEIKDSDFSSTYEYHKFDGGGGASFDIRF
jgi:hypothetical protein